MKKLVIVCLIVFTFCACVPTPDTDVVIGKADYDIHHTHSSDSNGSIDISNGWDEIVYPQKGYLSEIRYNTNISIDYQNLSIIKVSPVSFDSDTIKRVLDTLAPNTRIILKDVTKEDLEALIADILSELNNIDTLEFDSPDDKEHYRTELLQELDELKDIYANTEDNNQDTILDYSALIEYEKVNFLLVDDMGLSKAQCRLTCGIEKGDSRASKLSITFSDNNSLSFDFADQDSLTTKCKEILDTMQLNEFEFNQIQTQAEKQVYIFTRSFDDVPYSEAVDITWLQSRDYFDGAMSAEPYWLDESIRFTFYNTKLLNISWYSKSEYGPSLRTNVPIMPIDEAKLRITNGLVFQYSIELTGGELSHRIIVDRVQLGYKRIPAANALREYELVPAWTIIGRIIHKYNSPSDVPDLVLNSDNENIIEDDGVLLVINAIDGSIIG